MSKSQTQNAYGATIPPIETLSVFADACTVIGNEKLAPLLTALFKIAKKKGIECEYIQERHSLRETSTLHHELSLYDAYELKDRGVAQHPKVENYFKIP